MDVAQIALYLGVAATIIGTLWRVGTTGKQVGAQIAVFSAGMTALAKEVSGLASRLGHLEEEQRAKAAKHLQDLEAEVLALRQGHPVTRVRPRKAGLL